MDDERNAQRSALWKWASRIIIVVGAVWIAYLLYRDLDGLRANFRVDSVAWLSFTFVAGIAALLFIVPIFQALLSAHSGLTIRYTYAARMLFVAQILRHLPGRVWGIMYLVAETRETIPSAAMLRANLDVMLYSMYFNLTIAACLFVGVSTAPAYACALAVLLVAGLATAIRFDWIGRVTGIAARLMPRIASKLGDESSSVEPMPWPVVARIIVCNSLSWSFYLAIWWSFTRVFPALADVNIWLLCASYSAAWVIGYLAMITPAGLGVREAGFFALAGSVMALPKLAFLAVFIRVWQFIVEILVFLMFAFVKPAVATDNSTATANPG